MKLCYVIIKKLFRLGNRKYPHQFERVFYQKSYEALIKGLKTSA